MELNTLLQYKPYSTARPEKRALYAGLLTELTQFHRERCPEYGRLLDALGCPAHMDCTVENTPMLPVSLFKELELRSIPEGEVFKTITSSGTTGQRVSRIFLDGDTFFSGDYLIPGEEVILRLPGGSETDYRAVTEPVLRGLPPGLHICPGHGEPYILKGKE